MILLLKVSHQKCVTLSMTKQICEKLLFKNLKKNRHGRENVPEIKIKVLDECGTMTYKG